MRRGGVKKFKRPSESRRRGGQLAKQAGETLQNQIDFWADDDGMVGGWHWNGLDLMRTDSLSGGGSAIVNDKGEVVGYRPMFHRKRRRCFAKVDYVGSFRRNGIRIAIYIESKALSSHKTDWLKTPFPLGDENRIKEWQRETLSYMAGDGAIAFYLIWVYDQFLRGHYALIDPVKADQALASSPNTKTIQLAKIKAQGGLTEIPTLGDLPDYVRKLAERIVR